MRTSRSPVAAPGWVAVLAVTVAMLFLGWLRAHSETVDPDDAASVPRHVLERRLTQPPLPCLSYAPFRRAGHTPFDPALVVTPEQIESDLRLIATATRCIRTYGLDHGLDAVPALARSLGLRVVLGAWIGRDPAANRQQIERALELAASHRETVSMIVVGNEVLLRRELEPAALAALLADARRRSPAPVAYADVWEFWQRHAATLREHVDVVAVHVLPYWEDEPVALRDAAVHVRTTVARMREAFPDRRVWLAETGWPAAGRQRGPAVPGRLEQTAFVRALLDGADDDERAVGGMNLVEAFDQPWKRALEGTVGGHWGMFDATGSPRLTWRGAMVPWPWMSTALTWSLLGAAVGAGMAVLRTRGLPGAARAAGRADRLALSIVGAVIGAALAAATAWQWQIAGEGAVDKVSWAAGLGVVGVGVGAGSAMLWRLLGLLLEPPTCCAVAAGAWTARRGDEADAAPGPCLLPSLVFAWLAVQAVLGLQLAFDARYRAVSWPLLAATTAVALTWRLAGGRFDSRAREEQALAWLLAVTVPSILGNEGWVNAQAWSVVFACVGAAIAVLAGARGLSRAG